MRSHHNGRAWSNITLAKSPRVTGNGWRENTDLPEKQGRKPHDPSCSKCVGVYSSPITGQWETLDLGRGGAIWMIPSFPLQPWPCNAWSSALEGSFTPGLRRAVAGGGVRVELCLHPFSFKPWFHYWAPSELNCLVFVKFQHSCQTRWNCSLNIIIVPNVWALLGVILGPAKKKKNQNQLLDPGGWWIFVRVCVSFKEHNPQPWKSASRGPQELSTVPKDENKELTLSATVLNYSLWLFENQFFPHHTSFFSPYDYFPDNNAYPFTIWPIFCLSHTLQYFLKINIPSLTKPALWAFSLYPLAWTVTTLQTKTINILASKLLTEHDGKASPTIHWMNGTFNPGCWPRFR